MVSSNVPILANDEYDAIQELLPEQEDGALLLAGGRSASLSDARAAPRAARAQIEVGIDYYLANAPLQKNLYSDDIGAVACALCAPAFGAVTGEVLYVDNGMHAMGWAT